MSFPQQHNGELSTLEQYCQNGDVETVEKLVLLGFPIPNTCLHRACSSGSADMVRYLIGRGLDVNAVDDRGATPIFYVDQGEVDVIIRLLLINNADINVIDYDGRNCLFYPYDENTIRLLIDHGANPNIVDRQGLNYEGIPVGDYENDLRHYQYSSEEEINQSPYSSEEEINQSPYTSEEEISPRLSQYFNDDSDEDYEDGVIDHRFDPINPPVIRTQALVEQHIRNSSARNGTALAQLGPVNNGSSSSSSRVPYNGSSSSSSNYGGSRSSNYYSDEE